MAIGFDGTMYLTTSLGDTDPIFTDWCGLLEAVAFDNKNNLAKTFSVNIGEDNHGASIGLGEVIYVSGYNNWIDAYYPNGQLKTTKAVSGNIPPIFGLNGEMYVTSSDKKLTKFDNKFNQQWSIAGEGGYSPVIDTNGVIYTSKSMIKKNSWGGDIPYAYDKNITDVTEPLITKNILYLAAKNALYAVNPSTGNIIWTINVDPNTKKYIQPTHLNIDKSGHLYFCNATDNLVYSVCANSPLNPTDPWPMQRHDPGNTRNYNVPIK